MGTAGHGPGANDFYLYYFILTGLHLFHVCLGLGALFVVDGEVTVTIAGKAHRLTSGGFAYIPAGTKWTLKNSGKAHARFHWIRKAYEAVEGLPAPEPVIANENDLTPNAMPGADGRWATTRFLDPADMRFDFHVNIVTFEPGAVIPFAETHIMEHGLYVLEGKGATDHGQGPWTENVVSKART